ncbi:MAG: GNAT family N-acetyltransferase [Flavobacteriaceae bacterium]|jgi:predicted GNAT family N-acyltransferase
MNLKIVEIEAQTTFELRHPLLRTGRPIESCIMDDDDHPKTLHLGAYSNQQLVGILSAMPKTCNECKLSNSYQLRGIAVRKEFQGRGVAKLLLIKGINLLIKRHATQCIWLNSRIAAQGLYQKTGFKAVGDPFIIEPIGLHQRYKLQCS